MHNSFPENILKYLSNFLHKPPSQLTYVFIAFISVHAFKIRFSSMVAYRVYTFCLLRSF